MPRLKDVEALAKEWQRTGDWEILRQASTISAKHAMAKDPKPSLLYHGSPYKLKKGEKIKPKGPIFYGQTRPAVHLTESFGESKVYSRASDDGGLNKMRFGKDITPGRFSTKGYSYAVRTDNRPHPGVFKNHHSANMGNQTKHWAAYKAQPWESRKTVRHRGKLPITRNEAIVGGVALGVAVGGGAYYYRRRRNRLERVRKGR